MSDYEETEDLQYEDGQVGENIEEQDDIEADLQILKDASLRLEQGNLYKMLLKHDLFAGVEADERAVKNVQRELRSFIRERLEILVGLKTDPKLEPKQGATSSGFSSTEVELLKGMLSKVLGKNSPNPVTTTPSNTLNPVSNRKPAPVPNRVATQKKEVAAPLKKPLKDMTKEEIVERNKEAMESQRLYRPAKPANKVPMPDGQQMTNMYSTQVNTSADQGLVGMIMGKMGVQVGQIETAEHDYSDNNDSRI